MTEPGPGDGRFVLTLSRDALCCTAVIHAGSADSVPTDLMIRAALEEQRVDPRMLVDGAIEELLDRARAEPDAEHSAVIARGTEPVHGVDAGFTLAPELRSRFDEIKRRNDCLREAAERGEISDTPPAPDDPGDAIDFRAVSAFVIVRNGDVIGSIREATDGTDGMGVNGQVIPAKKGKSSPVKIGGGIEVRAGRAVASHDGVLTHRIDLVEISPTLEIRGDVGYETGNIDFPGDVAVNGGVKDHFVVKGDGKITIHKLVEASNITGGPGGVVFRQGMAGRGIGRLDLAGDLDAGYLDGVGGVIRGDLRVLREIKECTLRVEGRVDSPDCTIQGGRIESAGPVTLGVIGGPGGVSTEICIGRLEHYEDLADRAERLAHNLALECEKTRTEFESLKQSHNLTASQAERLTELQYVQISHDELTRKINDSCREMLDMIDRSPPTMLIAMRAIYKGTRIQLRNAVLSVREMVQGPIELEIATDGAISCKVRNEPRPVGEIALIEDTGERTDPVIRLKSIISKAA